MAYIRAGLATLLQPGHVPQAQLIKVIGTAGNYPHPERPGLSGAPLLSISYLLKKFFPSFSPTPTS